MRTPNSRERCSTEYASTPKMPTIASSNARPANVPTITARNRCGAVVEVGEIGQRAVASDRHVAIDAGDRPREWVRAAPALVRWTLAPTR